MIPESIALECMQPGKVTGYIIFTGDRVVSLKPVNFRRTPEVIEVEFEPYVYEHDDVVLATRVAVDTSEWRQSDLTVHHVEVRKGDCAKLTGTVYCRGD